MKQYVTFRLEDQLLGLEILLVREINQQMESTLVQHAPKYILGLVNLRGQIVTVFDLGVRLGMPPRTINDDTHNIILKSNGELSQVRVREKRDDLYTSDDTVGLRVDAIGDVVEFEMDQIEPVPANIGAFNERFIWGVVPMDNELLIMLNAKELLKNESEGSGASGR